MNQILFSLALAYTSLIGIAVLSLIYSRWHWLLKLLLVCMVLVFSGYSYQGWKQAQGWPTDVEVPERFLLNGAVVEEPFPEKGTEGNIFLWLSDLAGNKLSPEPRAYRLAYDEKLHVDIQQALSRMRDGKLQIGQYKPAKKEVTSAKFKNRLGNVAKKNIRFTDLPDPALPEK
jgi:hypothetical protein